MRDGKSFHILLGESNTSEAWTDGDSYIAIDAKIVKRLRSDPLKTAGYIFSLVEHEGDSLDCGHDEAFYQRFHDLSLHSEQRQRYMHMWLMKYTTSMEGEGKRSHGEAWREGYLVDHAGSDRVKKGLLRPSKMSAAILSLSIRFQQRTWRSSTIRTFGSSRQASAQRPPTGPRC